MSLSLDGVQNVVLLFSDPIYKGKDTVPSTIIKNLTAVSSDIAYSDHVTDNLTVLSSKFTETDNGVLQGLLYVPDLDGDDPCQDEARDFVPDSVVHQNNLPATNYNLVAIAPWFSKECTKSYLSSARYDPLRAFIFYLPSNDTTKPPGSDSDVWDLDDDGEWKTGNHFPIFAVSGALGTEMMYQLSLYSGNLTNVPFGDNISELYHPDPDDYVRIWTELTVSTPTGLPNVWVFILIVIGVLLAVITLTFLGMRYVWRQRRNLLRRRVISGEINLEAMGIKRLTVPLNHVQTFPLFTYNYDPPAPISPPSSPPLSHRTIQTVSKSSPSPIIPQPSPSPSPSSILASQRLSQRRLSQPQQHHKSIDAAIDEEPTVAVADILSQTASDKESQSHSHSSDLVSVTNVPASPTSVVSVPEASVAGDLDYQPMCHICLESFQSRVTIIRELPCGHIFHTECIDEFLSYVSSLCPLCKACMLPKGYCPPITNAMVRRERAMHKLRERIVDEGFKDGAGRGRMHSWSSSIKKHLSHATDRLSMAPSFNTATQERVSGIELKRHTVLQPGPQNQAQSQNPSPILATSEATRRRMAELAGVDTADLDDSEITWKAKTKAALSRIFTL